MIEIGDIVKLRYSSPQYKNMCSIVDSEAKRKYYIKNGQVLVGMTLEKHERILKEKNEEINRLCDNCQQLTSDLSIQQDINSEQEKKIAELKAENSGYDKALSGFRMWLSAKNRENVLLDPDEVKGELEQRIKESKETEGKYPPAEAGGFNDDDKRTYRIGT